VAENSFLPARGYLESNSTTFDLQFPYCLRPTKITDITLGKHATDIGTSLEDLEARTLTSEVPHGMSITMEFEYADGEILEEIVAFLAKVRSDYLPFHVPWDHDLWDFIPCHKTIVNNWLTYPGWRVDFGSASEGLSFKPGTCTHASFTLTIKNVLGEGEYI
jgi:hypothetical protein